MTEPVITPEIRQAVLDAECDTKGHNLDYTFVSPGAGGRSTRLDGAPDAMPYITCERCARCWIVAYRMSGRDYGQAERRFRQRLLATDPDVWVDP